VTTIAVVTPWFDHHELAADYCRAIDHGPYPEELIVVDNGSSPPIQFAALRNLTNKGFSAASNQGLHAATADIVVFLNNDVEMTDEGWLDTIRDATEPGVLTGARIRRDAHGSVDGHEFPYLDGWCLAGMREDLLALGGFDETLAEPAYYSDNLLCLRARMTGMTLRQVDVGLVHKVGMTAGLSSSPATRAAVAANYQRFAEAAREALKVAA
jgi:GT2 family glycosyltransferase